MSSDCIIKIAHNSVQQLEHIQRLLSESDINEQEKTSLIQQANTVLALWQAVDTDVAFSDNPELIQFAEQIRQHQAKLQLDKIKNR
ncbi:hypothetical protein [Plesiomonas sp.]|uniref:hypothetical protein n=1 Tax=Plesiomonas sp. TaxID=2486279 RepID=UPI003F3CDA75